MKYRTRKGRGKKSVAGGQSVSFGRWFYGNRNLDLTQRGAMNIFTRNTLFGLCLRCPDFRTDYLLTAYVAADSFSRLLWRRPTRRVRESISN